MNVETHSGGNGVHSGEEIHSSEGRTGGSVLWVSEFLSFSVLMVLCFVGRWKALKTSWTEQQPALKALLKVEREKKRKLVRFVREENSCCVPFCVMGIRTENRGPVFAQQYAHIAMNRTRKTSFLIKRCVLWWASEQRTASFRLTVRSQSNEQDAQDQFFN